MPLNPQIYRITEENAEVFTYWDLLTLDGNDPSSSPYFLPKDEEPDGASLDWIGQAVKQQAWEELTMEEAGLTIHDFLIVPSQLTAELQEELLQMGHS
ncbi:hypothetical protein EXU57_14500 [Segetibacter sp. 3557_3]|uniref:hypothetical protein n=1 Tax=Segetibacter sp. 3557_3 TaxID=2547429 RepID=UPI001058649E|nr:hypothetical protein [Segetibacter sp. 3557_3]TDH24549.1 hypothetical protein EXU57_14500 [Segetibacter sp. 3557_3]